MPVTHCSVCHRLLTDPASIAVGIGPECRSKLIKCGWRMRKPTYQVRHGKVELVSVTGRFVAPPPKQVPTEFRQVDRAAREFLERKGELRDERGEQR